MRRVLLALLFTFFTLHAASITRFTVSQTPDHVDLLLQFDAPYRGSVAKTRKEKVTQLLLAHLTAHTPRTQKRFDLPWLRQIALIGEKNGVRILLEGDEKLHIEASKTLDNRQMRIRIEKTAAAINDSPAPSSQPVSPRPIPDTPASAKNDLDLGFSFVKVMLVLAALIALLWWLRRRLQRESGSSWLFGGKEDQESIKILRQKPIDMKNRIALVEYEGRRYLLLLGESNLLLDRFEESEDEIFERLLAQKGKKLKTYLEE